jgi:hypothetical protein
VTDESPTPDRRAATAAGDDAAPAASAQTSGRPARPGRYQRTFGGLVGSIVAVLGVIAAVWLVSRILFDQSGPADPAPTISYGQELAAARGAAPFAVLAPDPAPSGWRATSVSWDGVGPDYAWHLGFLDGAGAGADYVGVEQSNADPAEFVPTATPADQPGPTVTFDGQTWQTLTSPAGETAVVSSRPDVTTVVTGTVPLDQLVAFAKTLSAG